MTWQFQADESRGYQEDEHAGGYQQQQPTISGPSQLAIYQPTISTARPQTPTDITMQIADVVAPPKALSSQDLSLEVPPTAGTTSPGTTLAVPPTKTTSLSLSSLLQEMRQAVHSNKHPTQTAESTARTSKQPKIAAKHGIAGPTNPKDNLMSTTSTKVDG